MEIVNENMQHMGMCGIYKESFKIINSSKKLFTQITLALILPLSIIFLLHMEVSNRVFWRIHYANFEPHALFDDNNQSIYDSLSHNLSSEWILYILFKVAYLTFLLIFSLLSTSAVVYSVSCIYIFRQISFKKVMAVVPNVWKRLMVTFLIIFLAIFVYNIVTGVILVLCFFINGAAISAVLVLTVIILYIVGFIYMSVVWQLASVVTVLEDSYGITAMKKSKNLIKGKKGVVMMIFLKLNLSLVIIQVLFQKYVVDKFIWKKIGFGILCVVLLVGLILLGLVIQTIIYLVCKSYHKENIEKLALSKQLDVYLGEYERLNEPREVQLERV